MMRMHDPSTWKISSYGERICGCGRCGYGRRLLVGGEYIDMEDALLWDRREPGEIGTSDNKGGQQGPFFRDKCVYSMSICFMLA